MVIERVPPLSVSLPFYANSGSLPLSRLPLKVVIVMIVSDARFFGLLEWGGGHLGASIQLSEGKMFPFPS